MVKIMDWFEKLFGFNELVCIDSLKSKLTIQNNILKSNVNGKAYNIGKFECLSLQNLINRNRNLKENINCSAKTRVHHIVSNDVFLLHTLPENKNALFMAASQFNCLEFVNPTRTPEHGVTCYQFDNTQGPACSLATGPGAVYRNYFCFGNGCIGQSKENQINNLDDVQIFLKQPFFDVKNGYVLSNIENIKQLNQTLKKEKYVVDTIIRKIKVGLHSGLDVVFKNRYELIDTPHQVSQVYCSAISCGYNYDIPIELWESFAFIVLLSSYLSVLQAAVYNRYKTGCKKVFLTFLGGGVFRNKMEWIIKAINIALEYNKNSDLDVYIVHYKTKSYESEILVL